MPGNVYCFNVYSETISHLTVNGVSVGSIAGWSNSGSNLYTPVSRPVPRARNAAAGVFANDVPTSIRIAWDSATVQTSVNLAGLPGVSLNDNLILYIAINQLTLMTARGSVLINLPVRQQD